MQACACMAVPGLICIILQDSALRLWNIKKNVCIMIIHGDGGHLNEVLTIVRAFSLPDPTLSIFHNCAWLARSRDSHF